MEFLSRLLVVIGLSVVLTLMLMVIHWEPEHPATAAKASTATTQDARSAQQLVSVIR